MPWQSVLRASLLLVSVLASLSACRAERVEPTSCIPGTVQDTWTDRRTPAVGPSDTARASLVLTLTTAADSLNRLPAGAMVSVLIAGPVGSQEPDTVRLLTAEVPGGPLWSGTDLRPGTYSASLTTNGFAAGPREFTLAPGEQLALEAAMGRTCEPTAK